MATNLLPQCEYVHPYNTEQSQLCHNKAIYWLRRGKADELVCHNHSKATILKLGSAEPNDDWGPQSQITVQLLQPDHTAYPRMSDDLRALRAANKA